MPLGNSNIAVPIENASTPGASVPLPQSRCNRSAELSEEEFYSSYGWCLNPILSLGELFQRLCEELDRSEALRARWQQEESATNLYLLICGIACVVDDYLARRLCDLSPISARFPRLRFALAAAQRFLDASQWLHALLADRALARWRRRWDQCVDRVCEMLASGFTPADSRWADLRLSLAALSKARVPQRLLKQRLPLPAAFRNQDLSPRDILSLARRFMACHAAATSSLVVIGLRTAGAYFGPLLRAQLSTLGAPRVSWFTIRPKTGLSRWEKQRLRMLRRPDVRVLVIDESPNTGTTFRLMLGVLQRCGVQPERVTILAPRNPARPDWTIPQDAPGAAGVTLIALDLGEFHKACFLGSPSIEALVREYYSRCGWEEARIQTNAEVDALNTRLGARHRDGFQVRLKRVFEVRLSGNGHEAVVRHVLVKSVGWGWLSYHAYIAGRRLAGFVPRVLGLRHGLLFTEWVGGISAPQESVDSDACVKPLASYVASRVRHLPLSEDPCFENPGDGWTGWHVIISILRRAYGPYVGRLKIPALRKALRRYVSPVPSLIDGRMRPDEWIWSDAGILKVDFEQHSFGKTELNIVDPASDLASAILEFRLSEQAERELLHAYSRDSGDAAAADRILLYKLLHGVLAMEEAASRITREPVRHKQQAWNQRYHWARNFLIAHMSRDCARRIPKPPCAKWSNRLFFLDLDGVFDCEVLGFPHTTASGLSALALLQSHGFSIVLNTGRSVADVYAYCQNYVLPGGLAEYGSVFIDAVRRREVPLIDGEAAEQLAECRAAIEQLPGVFVDPEYRYSIRTYRYQGERTVPPPAAAVENVLTRYRFDRLSLIPSSVDATIVQAGTNKGRGLLAAKRYLGCEAEPVVAIGDSDRDLPMLEAAEVSYAPAGCSQRIRRLAREGKCRVMAQPMQKGLLAAVQEVLGARGTAAEGPRHGPARSNDPADLIPVVLRVAERRRLRQCLSALNWRAL